MITLAIADDHEIFRDGLSLMLSKLNTYTIVAQAENGKDLLDAVWQHKPDVIITDIKMPIIDGIEATKKIIAQNPHAKIIALSMFDDDHLIVDMLEAGAKGYLLKNAGKAEIKDAIETVYADNNYYCHSTNNKLAQMIAKSKFNPYRKKEKIEFNERELEVIKLMCKQFETQQIADKLFVSKRTVEGYRQKILDKINVKNSAGIIIYAIKNGLVSKEDLEEVRDK